MCSNRLKNPKPLMSIGMAFLVVALTLPMFVHPTGSLGTNLLHGVRGMLLGISIVMNLWSVRLAHQGRCGGS